jgi:hypothetical protein
MTRGRYSDHATLAEIFGLVVGGAGVAALLGTQIIFLTWVL